MVVQFILGMRMGTREIESDTEDEKEKEEGLCYFVMTVFMLIEIDICMRTELNTLYLHSHTTIFAIHYSCLYCRRTTRG